MLQKSQDSLLNKPMDRTEFLKNVGVGAVFLLGGGMVTRALGLGMPSQSGQQVHSYGASAYGGTKA